MNQSSRKEEFLQSFDAYSDAIFRFCVVKTSDTSLAQDLTQEVFMRYWQSLQKGKQMTNTRSFLYTVAHNLITDWYRKKKATSLDVLEENGFEAKDTTAVPSEDQAAIEEILSVIEDLEEKDKEVLLLRFVEDLEPKEIASLLNESPNVVSVRIHRAIEKVQKKLHI